MYEVDVSFADVVVSGGAKRFREGYLPQASLLVMAPLEWQLISLEMHAFGFSVHVFTVFTEATNEYTDGIVDTGFRHIQPTITNNKHYICVSGSNCNLIFVLKSFNLYIYL